MNKPTVKCTLLGYPVIVGGRAFIIPTDHPRDHLNGQVCQTSQVEKIEALGFETENTIYVITEKV